ncbi:MAG: zf-HC2 domain-containing protein [Candidatus Acidiferrales bacterium]
MDIKCEEVWREISNYIDNDVDANLRAEMERHFAGCKHCSAVLDGTRNIVQIYGDERMFSVPAEFSPALQRRLAARLEPERSSKFTWLLSLAGAGLVAASLLIFSAPQFASPKLRAPMSEPALRAPSGMVAVNDEGKTFHVPGCTFLHGKYKLISVEEALREGYNPCIRCERELIERKIGASNSSAAQAAFGE